MKKILAVLLIASMILSIAGCSSEKEANKKTPADTTVSNETQEPTEEKPDLNIPVYDGETATVTLSSYESDDETYGTHITFKVINKRTDNIQVHIGNVYIDGELMFTGANGGKIAKEEPGEITISISEDIYTLYQIGDIDLINATLMIYDTDGTEAYNDKFEIKINDTVSKGALAEGTLVIDSSDVKVSLLQLYKNEDYGTGLVLKFDNMKTTDVYVSLEGCSVNGTDIDMTNNILDVNVPAETEMLDIYYPKDDAFKDAENIKVTVKVYDDFYKTNTLVSCDGAEVIF